MGGMIVNVRQRSRLHHGAIGSLILIFSILFTACSVSAPSQVSPNQSSNPAAPQGTIRIGLVDWAEAIVVSNLWKVILEREGYQVELKELDVAPLYKGLAQGDLDLFLDAWLPGFHRNYWEKLGNQLEDLGSWYEGKAYTGLAVPSYMKEVNAIADLEKHKEAFKGEIVGIDAGASVMRLVEEKVIPAYGLSYKLISSSEAAMLSKVRKAYQMQEPIVFLGWNPHWMFTEWDLKYLEDPKKVIPEGEEIRILAHKDFSEQYPEVADALKRFKLSDAELGEMENEIFNKGNDELAVVRRWVEENQALVDQWLGKQNSK